MRQLFRGDSMLIYYVFIAATTLNNYLIKNNLVSTFDF